MGAIQTRNLYALTGFLSLMSGITIITGKILVYTRNSQAGEILDFFSPLFGLIALTGIQLRQREKGGLYGWIAYLVLFTGLSLVLCMDFFGAFILIRLPAGTDEFLMNGPSGPVFVCSGMIFILGVILFGISVIRAGQLSSIAAILFIAGFVNIPLAGTVPQYIVHAGSVTGGVGLIWWGMTLMGPPGKHRNGSKTHFTEAPVC